MHLSPRTLENLREMINERTEYRSGPKLVQFFNRLGFSDVYGRGFPSRWLFTDERLAEINGTPALESYCQIWCMRGDQAAILPG